MPRPVLGPSVAMAATVCRLELFVSGLRRDASDAAMRAYFERHGPVVSTQSHGPRGFGFVEFETPAGVAAALGAPPPACGFFTQLSVKERPAAPSAAPPLLVDCAAVNLIVQVRGGSV